MKNRMVVAAGFAATLLASAPAGGFTFDDIHFWTGDPSGTNRIAVVVDWAGVDWKGNARALVWGYRWNGTAPNLFTVMKQVAKDDPRLCFRYRDMVGYVDLYFFGYDVNDVHASFDSDVEGGSSSDMEALAGRTAISGWYPYWAFYAARGSVCPTDTSAWPSQSTADTTETVAGTWYLFRLDTPEVIDYDTWAMVPSGLSAPEAAESPYAYAIYRPNDASFNHTDSENAAFNDPRNALGRPAIDQTPNTTDVMSGGMMQGVMLVNPVFPVWTEGHLFQLEYLFEPAALTVAFDHDVVDDPANPFGIDFIVYGNSLCTRSNNSNYTQTTDPDTGVFVTSDETAVGSSAEPGKVEVSADGTTWHVLDGHADSYMPTLGRVYDKANPDATLFEGNQWWGEPTNPLYPVDPRVTWESCAGLSLGELCRRYNGSAGGRGFDISGTTLPKDAKGRRYFRYVRITALPTGQMDAEGYPVYTQPEIDAVADVAPVSVYQNWVCGNFTWDKAYQNEKYEADVYAGAAFATNRTGFSALSANGVANGVNALFGVAPDDVGNAMEFRVDGIAVNAANTVVTLDVLAPRSLEDAVPMISVKGWSTLKQLRPKSEQPVFDGAEADPETGLVRNRLKVSTDVGRFFKLSISE